MDLSIKLQQQQNLVMTMQMHQAFQVLQLSGQELEDAVLEEIRENPALELIEEGGISTSLQHGEHADPMQVLQESFKEAGLDTGEIDWADFAYHQGFGRESKGGYKNWDDEASPIEMNVSSSVSLYEHLMEQFRLEICTAEERRAGEYILASLNDVGFLDCSYEEIIEETEVELDDVEGAILIIRELEPVGCGGRTVVESLVFQAEIAYPEDPFFPEIIRNHLPHIQKYNYAKIAKIMDMEIEDVEEYHKMLLELNPRPGSAFATTSEKGITPDIRIVKEGEEWQVVSDESIVPKIKINPMIEEMLQLKKRNKETQEKRQFADEHYRKAVFFIESLLRREQTLVRITKSILTRQIEYFEFGEEYLRPLHLRQVAEDLELNESTISRCSSNKYVDTPRGVINMKWFFCSGVKGLYGEEYAAEAIQVKIKRYVEHENPLSPVSDQQLTDMLAEEGVLIARRTVSKYREGIGLASSVDRKRNYEYHQQS